jgi:hypothetical protein
VAQHHIDIVTGQRIGNGESKTWFITARPFLLFEGSGLLKHAYCVAGCQLQAANNKNCSGDV